MIAKYILTGYGLNVRSLEGGLKACSTAFEFAGDEFEIGEHKIRLFQIR